MDEIKLEVLDTCFERAKGTQSESYVEQYQNLLKGLGYPVGSVDGVHGSNTDFAVKLFQRDKKIAIDGVCGRQTMEALVKAFKGKQKPPELRPKRKFNWQENT